MKDVDRATIFRRLKWILSNSGILTLAFEHFIAMVPATILVPIMVNNSIGTNVIDMSLVLFTSGLGTIVFSLCSGRVEDTIIDGKNVKIIKRIPAYLGSSFAYIGLTIYLIQAQMGEGVSPHTAYIYVGWSYIFSGILLVLLSFLYKIKLIEKFFSMFLPASVIGPAISLIGLELADTAVVDSGFNIKDGTIDPNSILVAMITLISIILFSLIKRKFWKNAAIIIGMVLGCIANIAINGVTPINWDSIEFFKVPGFHLPFLSIPPNWPRLLVSVIPVTLIVFAENIGRVTVINRMQSSELEETQLFNVESVKVMGRALLAHGCSSVFATALGSVPNTIYAENIAVMGIYKTDEERPEPDGFIKKLTNPFSVIPYHIAAGIAILFSFIDILQSLLLNIPKPVIGGMELFLFGIISAPGIQLLVDQRVNYKKVSNQIITAVVLITGISEISIKFSWFELKGMSLGLVVGCCVNAVILILKKMGLLCDPLSMDEVLLSCLSALPTDNQKLHAGISKTLMNINSISLANLKRVLSGEEGKIIADEQETQAEFLRDAVSHSKEIFIKTDKTIIKINKKSNRICMDIRKDLLPINDINMYINDYQDAIDTDNFVDINDADNKSDVGFLSIDLSQSIPLHKVEALIKKINWKKC